MLPPPVRVIHPCLPTSFYLRPHWKIFYPHPHHKIDWPLSSLYRSHHLITLIHFIALKTSSLSSLNRSHHLITLIHFIALKTSSLSSLNRSHHLITLIHFIALKTSPLSSLYRSHHLRSPNSFKWPLSKPPPTSPTHPREHCQGTPQQTILPHQLPRAQVSSRELITSSW